MLPADRTHVFEFRDESWYHPRILALLAEHHASLCVHDMPGSAVSCTAVGAVAYVRFHGATGKYSGSYTDATLRPWVDWLAEEHGRGREVYAYFNNDIGAHAVHDAQRLRALLARATGDTALVRSA